MSNAVTVLYCDVLVTYEEDRDVWTFSLRGRERSAPSLAKAKESIDKVPAEKKNDFQRVPVYCYNGWSSSAMSKGEITSIAEGRFSTPEVWVVINGVREKKHASNVFPIGPANDGVVQVLEQLQHELEVVQAKIKASKGQLQAYAVAQDEVPA